MNRREFLKSTAAAAALATASAATTPGWRPHPIKHGDGRGGWVLESSEIQFLHRSTGKHVLPFGVIPMDNGRIALICSWNDGLADAKKEPEKVLIAFSADRGNSWSDLEPVTWTDGRPIFGRPMCPTYLGNGVLTFQADPLQNVDPLSKPDYFRYFSRDYGRTWRERIRVQPASTGRAWRIEGNALVDRDGRIAEIGYTFGDKKWIPGEPLDYFVRWSADGGRTWTNETSPPQWRQQVEHRGKTYTRSVSEGALVRAANGWIVAALRPDMPPRYLDDPRRNDNLEGTGVSVSKDNGATWSPMRVLYESGRHHAHLLRLPGGSILMTLIVRADIRNGELASYRRGCEAILSHDSGLTWDLDHKYVLDEYEFFDGILPWNGECGHLSSALLDDGGILTAYGKYLTKGVSLIRWKPRAAS